DGRADVLEYMPSGVRRLRHRDANLKPLWEARLDDDDASKRPVVMEKQSLRWRDVLPRSAELPPLMQSTVDLNGDGSADLVWLSRATPAVLALSGRDGSPLWAYRAADGPGRVSGEPLFHDLGG